MSYSSIWNHSTRHHILLMNSVCQNRSKRQIDARSKPTRLTNSRNSATVVTMTSEIDPPPPPWPWVHEQRQRGGGGEGSQRKECVTVGAAKQIKSSKTKCQRVCEWETNTVTPRHNIPSPLLLQPRQPVITLSVIQVQIKVEAAADFRSLEHLWFYF